MALSQVHASVRQRADDSVRAKNTDNTIISEAHTALDRLGIVRHQDKRALTLVERIDLIQDDVARIRLAMAELHQVTISLE